MPGKMDHRISIVIEYLRYFRIGGSRIIHVWIPMQGGPVNICWGRNTKKEIVSFNYILVNGHRKGDYLVPGIMVLEKGDEYTTGFL
jgi:hypothetical protein